MFRDRIFNLVKAMALASLVFALVWGTAALLILLHTNIPIPAPLVPFALFGGS